MNADYYPRDDEVKVRSRTLVERVQGLEERLQSALDLIEEQRKELSRAHARLETAENELGIERQRT